MSIGCVTCYMNIAHSCGGGTWKADEAFGATHKATYRDVGNAMNHEYTDAAVEQRESHEDESQDWDLLFVGLAC